MITRGSIKHANNIRKITKKVWKTAKEGNIDQIGTVFVDELCRELLSYDYDGISARLEILIKEMKP